MREPPAVWCRCGGMPERESSVRYPCTAVYFSKVILLSSVGLLAACDESFVAFEDNDLIFSMYGHLDPSRPTQWLRVTPVRTSVETAPGPVDAVVTIEELETGRTLVMADSAFSYAPLDPAGNVVYVHNFSTSEPIRAGFSYRVRATSADGDVSEATVSIPDVQPWIVLRLPINALIRVDRMNVFGVEHVAVAQKVWGVPAECEYPLPTYTQYQPVVRERRSPDDFHEFTLDSPLPIEASPPCSFSVMGNAWIEVVASGEPWPYRPLLDRRDYSHPNVATNVIRGVGFIGGVLTKTFPYQPERCVLTVPGPYCDIVFDSESVTLEGSVIESCDGEPLSNVAISLREVAGTRIRPATTDSTGYFRIRGLEPETTYRLSVTRSRFLPYESDLVFEAAEVRTLPTIELGWEFAFDPCQFR